MSESEKNSVNEDFGSSDCYPAIYCDGENRPLKDALSRITVEWVANGESTDQTVIDLARACRALIRIKEFQQMEGCQWCGPGGPCNCQHPG